MELVLPSLVGWAELSSMAMLQGGLTMDALVLPAGRAELEPTRRRLGRWSRLAAGVLALTSMAELLIRARTMTGGGLITALAALPIVLGRTHFGLVWCARAVGL